MKDNRSLLLALLAIGLLVTWIYHIYDKSQYANKTKEILVKDTSAVVQAVSDSLRDFFTNTMDQLNREKSEIDSDTLASRQHAQKISEINNLKTGINVILGRETLNQEDLSEIQSLIDSLRKMIFVIKNESQHSTEKVIQPIITNQPTNSSKPPQQDIAKMKVEKKPALKENNFPVFTASAIRLVAYTADQQNSAETSLQETAKKFTASFTVKNNKRSEKNAEIIAVLTDPSGKSMIPEVWDAGSFETLNEGRKVYTKKINFDYVKGEAKRISFTVEPEKFLKGIYKLRIYYKGVRIGETNWKLS